MRSRAALRSASEGALHLQVRIQGMDQRASDEFSGHPSSSSTRSADASVRSPGKHNPSLPQLRGCEPQYSDSSFQPMERQLLTWATWERYTVLADHIANLVRERALQLIRGEPPSPTSPGVRIHSLGIRRASHSLRQTAQGLVLGPAAMGFFSSASEINGVIKGVFDTGWIACGAPWDSIGGNQIHDMSRKRSRAVRGEVPRAGVDEFGVAKDAWWVVTCSDLPDCRAIDAGVHSLKISIRRWLHRRYRVREPQAGGRQVCAVLSPCPRTISTPSPKSLGMPPSSQFYPNSGVLVFHTVLDFVCQPPPVDGFAASCRPI